MLLRSPDGSETIEVTDPGELAHYQSLGATLVQPDAAPAPVAAASGSREWLVEQLNAPHEDFQGMGMPPLGRLAGVAANPLLQEAGSLVARGAGAVARGAGKLANAPILRRLPGTGMVRGMAKDAAEMAGKGGTKAANTLEAAAPGGAPQPAANRASEAGRELAAKRWGKPATEAPKPGTIASRAAKLKVIEGKGPRTKPHRTRGKSGPALDETSAARRKAVGKDPSMGDAGIGGRLEQSASMEAQMKRLGWSDEQRQMMRRLARNGVRIEDVLQ